MMLKLIVRPTKRPSIILPVLSLEPVELKGHVEELEGVGFELVGLDEPMELRLMIGDVPAKLPSHNPPHPTFAETESYGYYWPPFNYFERWAGLCTVSLVDGGNPSNVVCCVNMLVLPSKITADELNQLLDDLSAVELGLILDVYGKTSVTASGQKRFVGIAPEFFLNKAGEALEVIRSTLPDLRRRPHTGYRQVMQEDSPLSARPLTPPEVSWLSRRVSGLAEATVDDGNSFNAAGRTLTVRTARTTDTLPDLNTYEHRALRWFLGRLQRGLLDLRKRALEEHAARQLATHHWWQAEDAPRLEPLLERARRCTQYTTTIEGWLRREPALVAARSFTPPLRPTAAFHRKPAYRKLYDAIRTFGETGEFRFADAREHYKMQNLSVLYEYWACLELLSFLLRHFQPEASEFTSIVDTERFILTLRSGYTARFHTSDGRWLRFRYEPAYVAAGTPGATYGRLARHQAPLRPDIVLEICSEHDQVTPDFLIVFDVKYKRDKQHPVLTDLEETANRYMTSIGRFDTWQSLVQHSWIIYPSDRPEPWTEFPLFEPDPPLGMKTRGFAPLLPGGATAFVRTVHRLLAYEGLLPVNT